ncbi:MAG: OmpA family protein [Bacteroidetes bacterium]|nr:MAG: OmpA family protein [Bacteroidota bacterium]
MKSMRSLLSGIIIFGLTLSVNAQNYLGIPQSNYSGVMGTDINPASFVDGRFSFDLNLFSFNFSAWQNAQTFDTDYMPKWWIKSFASDDELNIYKPNQNGTDSLVNTYNYYPGGSNPDNDWMVNPADTTNIFQDLLTRRYNENSTSTHGLYANIQVDVLNFMVHVNPKIAVGAAIKYRSVTNLDDLDPKLAILIQDDWNVPSLWGKQFNEELLNVNHLTWMEYGLIYSQVIKDDGEHFMKAGGKAKWLSGIAAAYMYTDNFSYQVYDQDTLAYVSGDVNYGHSTGILEKMGNGEKPTLSDFTTPASKFGLGLDLGFVYEWRPDWKDYKYDMDGETNIWRRDQEKYKMRFGASILDIGGMKFTKGNLSRDFSVNDNINFDFRDAFKGVSSLPEIDEKIDSLIVARDGWTANESVNSTFFMMTPTALNLQFDYNIYKWFYVNATGNINVLSRKTPHRVRTANYISVTPSFDHAWFGVHLPFVYNKYSGFKSGLGLRLGPLTVGVTDWGVLLGSGHKRNGATFYAGLRVPVLYGHPSDVDGDLVSDKLDECLVVPGVWEFKGCPDTDRDGIKDMDDLCPNEPGLAEFNGCPDKDGDKIPDKDDDCPDLAGDPAFKGCPDRDNDSIIDPKDKCPDVPGLAKYDGCPDTDGDGIIDDEDACPDVAGPLVNNGCPDTDNDGLFDFIDNCPTEAGPKENNGCPWPDTDGDGLLDKDDQCPNLAGPIANKGCPYQDTDNDGVLDKDDKCPNTPGPVANEGCPEIEKEVEEILKTAFENLEFETGKDIIKEVSIPSLSELAEVLNKKPDWRLQIAGHTDNVGDAQANLVLSKKRAEAVKRFMESKGISSDRLVALYFGETQPIADNNTPEGRQKNRRVEMTIIFK